MRAAYDITWGMLDDLEARGVEIDESLVQIVKACGDAVGEVGTALLGDRCICRTRAIGSPCPQHGYSDEGLRR